MHLHLYINGNGGFVGNYLNQTFLNQILLINQEISFYILIFFILLLFLISINFHPLKFYKVIVKTFSLFKKKEKNYTDKSEIISEYIPQDEIKNLIQEDLPFIKAEHKKDTKIKFKLPNLDLLKNYLQKKKRGNLTLNENNDPEVFRKNLNRFWG